MYKIIGADLKEYGPVSAEQIRTWIAEGRLNAQTKACLEGTQDWKPLGMFPEFGFTTTPFVGNLPPIESGPVSIEEMRARDYSLDILSCVSRAWELFKNNSAVILLPFVLAKVLHFTSIVIAQVILGIAGMDRISVRFQPYLGLVSVIFISLIMGPVTGSLYRIFLSVIRGHPTNPGELFFGFKTAFQDLFLGQFAMDFVFTAFMIPGFVTFAVLSEPVVNQVRQHPESGLPPEMVQQFFHAITASAPRFLLFAIPSTYFFVNWLFVLPLIIDKQMGFWMAMKTSWKMVHKHWFQIFGLVVLAGLLNVAGFCFCCVGLLVTFPLGMIAWMYAYEDIFGRKTA